ncbi:hypothetical protein BJY16_004953 [Actinoplanes octamycinicus]|uniref:Uncharacterized protein n=1 Tax=Actinoplanes octamycinicus TaxID=135948 RepID=A0A7W7H0A7_9ACTN|nr:hypothetical protein [Actinoplanes octamycinicus]MBB4741494.1 hypothetical protein [Actinoplanes octamycinicus]GIE57044.1 hypothetical protein Aoc01nite_24460 [Actinoplanes octamycinicus]
MDRPLLTPEERELLAEAERQATAGLTVDVPAALADLKRRARRSKIKKSAFGTPSACRRALPPPHRAERATRNRLRPAVLGFAGLVVGSLMLGTAVTTQALVRTPTDQLPRPAVVDVPHGSTASGLLGDGGPALVHPAKRTAGPATASSPVSGAPGDSTAPTGSTASGSTASGSTAFGSTAANGSAAPGSTGPNGSTTPGSIAFGGSTGFGGGSVPGSGSSGAPGGSAASGPGSSDGSGGLITVVGRPDRTPGHRPPVTPVRPAPHNPAPGLGAGPTPPPPARPTSAPEPTAPPAALPGTPAADEFRLLYQATKVTVPLVHSQSRPIDLVQPHLKVDGEGGGDVRISESTGSLYLYTGDDVRAATVRGDTATPAECAAAFQEAPSRSTVELNEEDTYCLITPSEEIPGRALIRLNVLEPPPGAEKVTLKMAAWDTEPS